jgi:hypothetical protein
MWDSIAALIPPFAMCAVFIGLLVTAFRATDGKGRNEDDPR